MGFYWDVTPALYSGLMIGLMAALVGVVRRYPPGFLSAVRLGMARQGIIRFPRRECP